MDSNIIKYILLIFFFSLKVSAVELNGKFIQGHFIIGKTEPNSKVKIDKKQIRVSKDGYFAFGLARDRKYDVVITIVKNGVKEKIIKRVQKRKYNIQRIDGLEEKMVTPTEEVYERIKKENKSIAKARAVDTSGLSYKTTRSSFCLPNLSLPVSVTKYVSPRFIANCASLSIKIICIKNTIPGFIIRGFPVKIIGGTSIQLGENVAPNE